MCGRVAEVHQGSLSGVGSAVGQDGGGLGRRTAAAPGCPWREAQLHVRLRVSSLHFVFTFLQHRGLQWRSGFVTVSNSALGLGVTGIQDMHCQGERSSRQGDSSKKISVFKIYH